LNRNFNLRFAIGTIAILAATIATTGIAQAQSYPTRPITLLVPFAAGSATDTVARLVGTKMSAQLGKPVIIDNLAGAGGTLAATRVARAAPDGYTLLIHTTIALSAVLYKHLDYDTATAFEPIGLINSGPYVLTSRLGYEAKDAKDFLASLQEKGEKVAFAHAGIGTGSHLCALMLMQALNFKTNLVPYRSTSLAMNDVVASQVDVLCDQTTNSFPLIESKAVRGYAITSPKRHPRFPDIPTTAEIGLPQVDVTVWHGLYAPKGTPIEILDKLNAALQVALADSTVDARLAALGTELFPADQRSREAHAKKLASELTRLREVVQKADVHID
jgi:tripartite-type tricarboxylate transporter receptor subunit TctC